MSLKCNIGIHNWDGCTCSDCGKTRDENHDLKNDCGKCSKCGKEVAHNHDWSKDCEKCAKCGKTREDEHSFYQDCEKCSKCGKKRKNMHKMEKGMCVYCGHGVFTDKDGKDYQVIKIGKQVIMAQNYASEPSEGNFWYYDNNEENKEKYGLLYDWETAKNIVPKGWHLPTQQEWDSMLQALGGKSKEVFENLKEGSSSGFDVKFGGWRSIKGVFNGDGASAHFWSDTTEGADMAWQLKLSAYNQHPEFEKGEKELGLSIRLFKD